VILTHRLGTFLGIQGTPERAGFSPLGRSIQDHLQLITFLLQRMRLLRRMERSP
jgi:hypothetical protein